MYSALASNDNFGTMPNTNFKQQRPLGSSDRLAKHLTSCSIMGLTLVATLAILANMIRLCIPVNLTNSYYFSVKIAAGAVVCVESEIRGDVTIGKVFPRLVTADLTNPMFSL